MAIRNGTNSSYTLYGTSVGDAIYGRGGNDSLKGFGGADYLDGGAASTRCSTVTQTWESPSIWQQGAGTVARPKATPSSASRTSSARTSTTRLPGPPAPTSFMAAKAMTSSR